MKLLARFLIGINFILFLINSYFYYAFYWKYRNLFNEEGNYFDPVEGVVYHEQSGFWLIVVIFFGVLTMLSYLYLRYLNKMNTKFD